MDWVEKIKSLPRWLQAGIAFVTAVITFLSLLRSNVYLGLTALVGVILIAGLLLSLYLALAKKPSTVVRNRYVPRFPDHQYIGVTGAVISLVLIVGLFAFRPTRSFAVVAFAGTPTPDPLDDFSVSNVVVAEKDDFYRLEVDTYNPLDRDVLVRSVTVRQAYESPISCGETPWFHFVLSDTIKVSSKEDEGLTFELPVFPQEEELAGYQYAAEGKWSEFCMSRDVELSFDSSFVLPAKAYTTVLIDVPKVLRVMEADVNVFDGQGFQPIEAAELEVELGRDMRGALTIELDTDVGPATLVRDY